MYLDIITCANYVEIFSIVKEEFLAIILRCLWDSTFIHFGTIPACNRQTKRQTDGRQTYESIHRSSIASHAKN